MPELQAQLALYGAIDEALVTNDDPAIAGTVEKFLPGTTGFGQRGWYREALEFLATLAPARGLTAPDLQTARAQLTGAARVDVGLPASVTARSIFAEVVLENIARIRDGTHLDTLGPLSEILAVAPTPTTVASSDEPRLLGEEAGAELAQRIQARVSNRSEFRSFMDRQSNDAIASAVASYDFNAFLRRVRDEYCSVITTDATWTDVTFDELVNIADPENWDKIYHGFFCAMTPRGETAQGWSAVLETVSGDCSQYSMTTALKFWKQLRDDHLFLNYDLDEAKAADGDRLVLVDTGYVWITRTDGGVRVRTSKELLIRGLSSTATTALAGGLGWADNASDMFRNGAKMHVDDLVPFSDSTPKAVAPKTPQAKSFPIDPPVLPADIRAEGVDDTIDVVKDSITRLAGVGSEFASRWSNGLDRADIQVLGTRLGAVVTDGSVALFDSVSSNFRPAPIPRPTAQEEPDDRP